MAGGRTTIAHLKDRCRILEATVTRRGYAEVGEVDLFRPGGEKNNTGAAHWRWTFFFAQLTGMMYRSETHEWTGEQGENQGADQAVMDALRGQPIEVELARSAEGKRESIFVHPKSMAALLECEAREHLLDWLRVRYLALQERGSAEDIQLLPLVNSEISYQLKILCWVVCSPGPECPFELTEDNLRPDPPEPYASLDLVDLIQITRAHIEVNARRLNALQGLVQPRHAERPGGRPSWSVFFGSASREWKKPAKWLMKHAALAELIATVQLSQPEERDEQQKGPSGKTLAEEAQERTQTPEQVEALHKERARRASAGRG